MSDEDIDSDEEAPFDDESDDDGLVAMSDEDTDGAGGEEDEGEGEEDEDESDGSDDGDNDAPERNVSSSQAQATAAGVSQSAPRASSPTLLRREAFQTPHASRSYTIEPIIALPHPEGTHALAASVCMSHVLTGSEDGFIRDYDIFASANGKALLTAQQRSWAGLTDINLKAGTLRSWWENSKSVLHDGFYSPGPMGSRSPIYSMILQADALWGLSGTKEGPINLFTIRHDPGHIHHVLPGHKDAVSSMCLTNDESSLLSAGWDGLAMEWDLNTGQLARQYPSHGAQLTTIATRPLSAPMPGNYNPYGGTTMIGPDVHMMSPPPPSAPTNGAASKTPSKTVNGNGNAVDDADGESDDYDPLFDDEDGDSSVAPAKPPTLPNGSATRTNPTPAPAPPSNTNTFQLPGSVAPPSNNIFQSRSDATRMSKNTTPILDPATYHDFSPDIFMTAGIDGQITLWDRRASTRGVGRLDLPEKTPPWCISACWSADGANIYAGRRNGTIDVWDMRKYGPGSGHGQPKVFRTLRNPASSGSVNCVAAFPDRQHIVCASQDNIRLWNASLEDPDNSMAKGRASQSVPFKIIAGHHGLISQIHIDPSSKFMITASGNRGWWGDSTRSVIVHSIVPQR